jgi:hypothetical protein
MDKAMNFITAKKVEAFEDGGSILGLICSFLLLSIQTAQLMEPYLSFYLKKILLVPLFGISPYSERMCIAMV